MSILHGLSTSARLPGRLFFARAGEQFVQARFAPLRGVAMNDAALGRFIDRRNESAHFVGIEFGRGTRPLLHAAETRDDAAIAERLARGLAGTFRRGFCVSHSKLWARRLVEPHGIVKVVEPGNAIAAKIDN
jgi:hypothetical protein